MTTTDDLVERLINPPLDDDAVCTLAEQAAAELTRLQGRIGGYQASRDYAIDLLAAALGIDADKMRAVEYYARLAAERVAALEAENARLKERLEVQFKRLTSMDGLLANAEAERDALRADAERFVFWFGTGLLASQTLDWYRERVDAARKEGK